MSCINSANYSISLVGHSATNRRNLPSLSRGSSRFLCLAKSPLSASSHQQNLRLVSYVPKSKRFSIAHAFGEEGKSGNESLLWESLKKFMGSIKKDRSVGDFAREVQKRGLGGNGGGRNSRRGGGGGGGDDNSGDREGGLVETLEEIKQVILAFLGVVFMYIFLIRGQEIYLLARDYIKYLLGGRPSLRLRRTMETCQEFCFHNVWNGRR